MPAMRRLLVPALVLPLLAAVAPAAHAGCDPDGTCHPVDCLPWQPSPANSVRDVQNGEYVRAVTSLLPPSCG
jgi:hypothetical protein